MITPPTFEDCLITWLKEYHPKWELINHVNDNWGDGVFLHLTHHVVTLDDIEVPHIAVTETGIMDCCGIDQANLPTHNIVEPDFFEKLSALIVRKEETYKC